MRSTRGVQTDYDESVESYDKVRFGNVGGQYVNNVEQDFVAIFIKGSRVLEVGTATGRFAVTLIKRGAEYTGVDISQKMLRTTYERISHTGVVVRMDGCHLGFGSYFDNVQCVRTFHFLPNRLSDVEEMFLKAGFKIERSGSVMRIPVTLYRRCPRFLLPILKRSERLWPWPMHQFVLGAK